MISFISSFYIIIVVAPDPNIFLWKSASVADTATVNPNRIKMSLAKGLSSFFIKGKPVFSNGSKTLRRNTPDYSILCNSVFDNFILADELFPKALRSFGTCVLVNNNLCGISFSSLESSTTFNLHSHNKSFKVTSVQHFIPDFNFLSYKLYNFTFKVLYWVIL